MRPLCDRLEEALSALLERLPPGNTRDVVADIRVGLAGPLRVAVVGRVNSGKSTLVNALLEQRVAATDVSECTRLVTWYRYGVPERVEVEHEDGDRQVHALRADGSLPGDLDLGPTVRALHVHLPNDALRDLTIVDTPGLASAAERTGTTTEELLALDRGSSLAVREADAVVHVMALGVHRDEVALLEGFRSLLGGARVSAVNAVVVLNKCDLLDGDDPLETGAAVAARHREALDPAAVDVVPTVGLLAETADAGGLRESDLQVLRELAVVSSPVTDAALLSVDRFVSGASLPGTPEARARLLARLDRHGVDVVLAALRAGADTDQCLDTLRERSGLPRLRRLLTELFRAHADAMKADTALTAVEQLARHLDTADPERLRLLDLAEELRLDPAMHRLAEVRALRDCVAGVPLPADLLADLRRLVLARDLRGRLGVDDDRAEDAAARQRAAVTGARRWKAFTNDPRTSPGQRAVGAVVSRSYDMLWSEAGERVP